MHLYRGMYIHKLEFNENFVYSSVHPFRLHVSGLFFYFWKLETIFIEAQHFFAVPCTYVFLIKCYWFLRFSSFNPSLYVTKNDRDKIATSD